jgi:hypothetical protein
MRTQKHGGARPDNRLIALENDLAVLKLVANYGHLRRSEIARGIWPHSTSSVAEKMAFRTVKRLIGGGHLHDRPNSLGGRSLVLTARGVGLLRSHGIEARAGHELSSVGGPHFYHRTLGSRYLIERLAQGHAALGEYALATGRGFIQRRELRDRFGKIPDGLVLIPGHERGYAPNVKAADWVEVESSFKPKQELSKIFDIAWKVGSWLDGAESVLLDRVLFVYDESQRHESSILASLERYCATHPATESVLASIAFVRCELSLPLLWHGHRELSYQELATHGW